MDKLLIAMAAACLAGPASAADLTSVSITGGIPAAGNLHHQGEFFYTASFDFLYEGGKVKWAGNKKGNAVTTVDDLVNITVTHPDGSVHFYVLDYSSDCQNPGMPMPPINIASYFAPGLNKVSVEMQDWCGGQVGSSALWMSNF